MAGLAGEQLPSRSEVEPSEIDESTSESAHYSKDSLIDYDDCEVGGSSAEGGACSASPGPPISKTRSSVRDKGASSIQKGSLAFNSLLSPRSMSTDAVDRHTNKASRTESNTKNGSERRSKKKLPSAETLSDDPSRPRSSSVSRRKASSRRRRAAGGESEDGSVPATTAAATASPKKRSRRADKLATCPGDMLKSLRQQVSMPSLSRDAVPELALLPLRKGSKGSSTHNGQDRSASQGKKADSRWQELGASLNAVLSPRVVITSDPQDKDDGSSGHVTERLPQAPQVPQSPKEIIKEVLESESTPERLRSLNIAVTSLSSKLEEMKFSDKNNEMAEDIKKTEDIIAKKKEEIKQLSEWLEQFPSVDDMQMQTAVEARAPVVQIVSEPSPATKKRSGNKRRDRLPSSVSAGGTVCGAVSESVGGKERGKMRRATRRTPKDHMSPVASARDVAKNVAVAAAAPAAGAGAGAGAGGAAGVAGANHSKGLPDAGGHGPAALPAVRPSSQSAAVAVSPDAKRSSPGGKREPKRPRAPSFDGSPLVSRHATCHSPLAGRHSSGHGGHVGHAGGLAGLPSRIHRLEGKRQTYPAPLQTLRQLGAPDGPRLLRATANYAAMDEQELTFNKGDLIQFVQMDDSGWVEGKTLHTSGWFPREYVECLSVNGVADDFLTQPGVQTTSLLAERRRSARRLETFLLSRVTREELVDRNILPSESLAMKTLKLQSKTELTRTLARLGSMAAMPASGMGAAIDANCMFRVAVHTRKSVVRKLEDPRGQLAQCRAAFNHHAQMGVDMMVQNGFCTDTPSDVAAVLHAMPGLDKAVVGEFLSGPKPFNCAVLEEYLRHLDFSFLDFDVALRRFLQTFRMPGEAQKIDRLMDAFASAYFHAPKDPKQTVFSCKDTVFILAFSVIMLNTDAHNTSIKKKMTEAEFLSNNRGIDQGRDLPPQFLADVYRQIVEYEIRMEEEETLPDAVKRGYLSLERRNLLGSFWKRRWVVLDRTCLYIFKSATSPTPIAALPLEGGHVRVTKGLMFSVEAAGPASAGLAAPRTPRGVSTPKTPRGTAPAAHTPSPNTPRVSTSSPVLPVNYGTPLIQSAVFCAPSQRQLEVWLRNATLCTQGKFKKMEIALATPSLLPPRRATLDKGDKQ